MTSFERGGAELEGGWVLTGSRGDGAPIRLVFGETELSRAYLGLTVGRHAALCDRVIDDPGISRRHLRVGTAKGRLFAEDLNSLNGTLLDGEEIPPFQPAPLSPAQVLILGQVVLTVARLADEAA
ncbi:MAG TPA: FHA domain-containing protein [Geminicoccaceae bacterium]|nr:FHA domain-containing protein [Geminicoccaceae bacterium]